MSRFSLFVRQESGRARLVGVDRAQGRTSPIGVFVLDWLDYERIIRLVLNTIAQTVADVLAPGIAEMLWDEARRASNDDQELAKQKLAAIGMTQDKINLYAAELGRRVGQKLVAHVPEQKPSLEDGVDTGQFRRED